MEYIELLPDDEVFPSTHVELMQMRSVVLFLLGLDASSPSAVAI